MKSKQPLEGQTSALTIALCCNAVCLLPSGVGLRFRIVFPRALLLLLLLWWLLLLSLLLLCNERVLLLLLPRMPFPLLALGAFLLVDS